MITFFFFFLKRRAEYFKTIFPDICEIIFKNIALYCFTSSFNIKTGTYITVCHNACRIYTCTANEIPVTNRFFIFQAQIMCTAV